MTIGAEDLREQCRFGARVAYDVAAIELLLPVPKVCELTRSRCKAYFLKSRRKEDGPALPAVEGKGEIKGYWTKTE